MLQLKLSLTDATQAPEYTYSTKRVNTFTLIDLGPTITRKPCDSDAYKPTELYIQIQRTRTHTHAHYRCTGTKTHRLARKLSRLKSSVGLVRSYLVSIELCACLQYAEQNSHSGPKSFSLCEYETKTRGGGSKADMKTMWSWFASEAEQTSHRDSDHKRKKINLHFNVSVCAGFTSFVATCTYKGENV